MAKTDYWAKLENNAIYHIYNRAIGRDNLFLTDDHYQFFLKKWKAYLPYLDVYAFCLMPNHFHFLAKVKTLSEELRSHVNEQQTVKSRQFLAEEIPYSEYLEDQFKRLFSSYALAFNKQQNRHGSLFQKGFKRVLVFDDYKLHYLLAYIHHNPIHHFFSATYEGWKYSSWQAYQHFDRPSILNREEVWGWFEEDVEQARLRFYQYHNDFKADRVMENYTFD